MLIGNLGLILTAIRADGRIQQANIPNKLPNTVELVAQLPSTGMAVRLSVQFSDSFPVVKPIVNLLERQPSHLEHVNHDGEVCVVEDAGLSSNLNDPLHIACWWLDRTLTVLDSSYTQALNRNFTSLLNEFAGYWAPIGKHDVQLLVEPFGNQRIVTGYVHKGLLRAVDVAGSKISKTHPLRSVLAQHEKVSVAYLPLVKAVLPPDRGCSVGPSFLRKSIDAQPNPVREKMLGMLRSVSKANPDRHYLLSQRAPDGMLNTVGMSIQVKRGHPDPVFGDPTVKKVIPWNVTHHYRSYQVPRGGALPDLTEKTVAIVGCGSLGGTLARILAQSGVGNLHLIDNDIYSADNVYRHVLPPNCIGLPKSEALKKELLAQFDGVNITSSQERLDRVEDNVFAMAPDVVCLATGSPDVERDLIRRRLSIGATPPLISGWIEPLSLGGHVMISDHGRHGCLECNYSDLSSGCGSMVSFLFPGQHIQRSLMGCAGSFTPYSAADAMQTAAVMARTVQEKLLEADTPFYRFWRGSTHLANAADIKTSHWYKRCSNVDSESASAAVKNSCCQVCGSWKC